MQLGRFRGQRQELARPRPDDLEHERAVATGTRGQDDAVGAELRKAADQLQGLGGIRVEIDQAEVGTDVGDVGGYTLVSREDFRDP